VRDLVLRYYFFLRDALRSRGHLRRCLVRCRHCRIFFLTDPRNAGRRDLGCPFGCADALRRQAGNARSKAYYHTPGGHRSKAALNRERNRRKDEVALLPVREEDERTVATDGPVLDAGIVDHVRVVVSLIEGFPVSREEVVAMLREVWRQRRMVRERRIDYVLRWLGEHPP
jgi:hypothetical protein